MARNQDRETTSAETQTAETTSTGGSRTSTQQDTEQVVSTRQVPGEPQILEQGPSGEETTQLTSTSGSKVTVPSRMGDTLRSGGRFS